MRLTVFSLAMYYMVKSVVQLDCPLEVAGQSYPSFHVDWSSIKVSDVTFSNLQRKHGLILNPKIPFYVDLTAVSFPGIFAHVCQRQKTSCAAVVSTPIVFSMKWHPSKLMGCNHHHKYTVTRSTARSWVFNSQSMGCKEWQAWGTQFPISLTAPSENWKRIHPPPPKKFCLFFRFRFCLLNLFWDCRGETFIRCICDKQSILLTLFFRHPSTLSSGEIILIKVCHLLLTDLLRAR